MRKTLLVFLHGLSLGTLVWIGWTVVLAVQKSSIGAYWGYQSGIVYGIDAGHPSARAFQIGDQIVPINDLSSSDLYKLEGMKNGESIHLQVRRNDQMQDLVVQVVPSSLPAVLERLPAFFVALGFWLAGSYVLAFSRSRKQAIVFFLLSQCAVLALTCGAISAYGPVWTKFGFHCGILWLGVFAVQLHLVFPTQVQWRHKRIVDITLVSLTALLSICYILQNVFSLKIIPAFLYWPSTFLVFTADMAVVISALIYSFRKASSILARQQVGIITLCSLLGIIPVVILIYLPQVINGYPIVSFNLAFLALLAIPLGYGFT
ncbi:hypothetical protein EG832_15050, partial [bacterium]|nr:hypothetical protein [bacterium]